MTVYDDHERVQQPKPNFASDRLLSELKRATLHGDPTSVYQAILLCNENQAALPDWLIEHLLELIANYHLGNKPSWKGEGNRPIIVIRRRFEDEVRRRAVLAVRAWVKDSEQYRSMPTRCIKAWNRQDYLHQQMNTDDDALAFASYGLRDVSLHIDGPVLKISARTLRRVIKKTEGTIMPALSPRIASIFGFTDPDSLFGYDIPLKPHLK